LDHAALLDARSCDRRKKTLSFQYQKGHNYGICSTVYPFGIKVPKKASASSGE
jgi:hypothetical protein